MIYLMAFKTVDFSSYPAKINFDTEDCVNVQIYDNNLNHFVSVYTLECTDLFSLGQKLTYLNPWSQSSYLTKHLHKNYVLLVTFNVIPF